MTVQQPTRRRLTYLDLSRILLVGMFPFVLGCLFVLPGSPGAHVGLSVEGFTSLNFALALLVSHIRSWYYKHWITINSLFAALFVGLREMWVHAFAVGAMAAVIFRPLGDASSVLFIGLMALWLWSWDV